MAVLLPDTVHEMLGHSHRCLVDIREREMGLERIASDLGLTDLEFSSPETRTSAFAVTASMFLKFSKSGFVASVSAKRTWPFKEVP